MDLGGYQLATDHFTNSIGGQEESEGPPNPPINTSGVPSEAENEGAPQQLGCSKCRFSQGGCARCRHPHFRPRRGLVPRDELAAAARQQRRAARRRRDSGGEDAGGAAAAGAPRAGRGTGRLPKRRRRATSGLAQADPQGLDSLLRQLRRHLGQQEQPSAATSEGLAQQLEQLRTWGPGEGGAARAPPAWAAHPPGPGGEPEPAATAAAAAADGGEHLAAQSGVGTPPPAAPEAVAAAAPPPAACTKRRTGEASDAELPGSLGRPAKQRRVGAEGRSLPAPPQRAKRLRSPGAAEDDAGSEGPPSRYRRVLPSLVQQGMEGPQQAQHGAGAGAGAGAAAGGREAAGSLSSGSVNDMEIDEEDAGPAGARAVTGEAMAPAGPGGWGATWAKPAGVEKSESEEGLECQQGSESDDARHGGQGQEPERLPQLASGAKRSFMALLEANMERRRRERRQSGAGPLPQLLQPPRAAKRQRREGQVTSPAVSLGRPAAGAAGPAEPEPDPRLCLWEPPASPFGLLEEELYDDPWKLLVACMLLNKTTGQQVRKVIWDLFALCPSPTAAASTDVAAIEALIQPLGLFRKRALAIQRLSREYLEKQWRDPQELYGIGKYAADAYYIFCRGRWREVAPEDKDLLKYLQWLEGTGGQGSGLTRHRTVPVSQAGTA